jgi:hypothetical protein
VPPPPGFWGNPLKFDPTTVYVIAEEILKRANTTNIQQKPVGMHVLKYSNKTSSFAQKTGRCIQGDPWNQLKEI